MRTAGAFSLTRNIFCMLIIAAAAGCSGRDGSLWRFDGIVVPDPGEHPQVREALTLLRDKEPALYSLLRKHVRKIDTSLYHEMSYPFYDYLYLAQAALDRGGGYTASVVGHELMHVVINGVRRKTAPAGDIRLLGIPELTPATIAGMPKIMEEGIAYRFQEKLLLKFGTDTDIEYHRLRVKKINEKRK